MTSQNNYYKGGKNIRGFSFVGIDFVLIIKITIFSLGGSVLESEFTIKSFSRRLTVVSRIFFEYLSVFFSGKNFG